MAASSMSSQHGARKTFDENSVAKILITSSKRVHNRASKHVIHGPYICRLWHKNKNLSESLFYIDSNLTPQDPWTEVFDKIIDEMRCQMVDLKKGDIIQILSEQCDCEWSENVNLHILPVGGEGVNQRGHSLMRNENLVIFDGEKIIRLDSDINQYGHITMNGKFTVPDQFCTGYWKDVLGYNDFYEQIDPNIIELIAVTKPTTGLPEDNPIVQRLIHRNNDSIYAYWTLFIDRSKDKVKYSFQCKNHRDNECACERVIVAVVSYIEDRPFDEEQEITKLLEHIFDGYLWMPFILGCFLEDMGITVPMVDEQFDSSNDKFPNCSILTFCSV